MLGSMVNTPLTAGHLALMRLLFGRDISSGGILSGADAQRIVTPDRPLIPRTSAPVHDMYVQFRLEKTQTVGFRYTPARVFRPTTVTQPHSPTSSRQATPSLFNRRSQRGCPDGSGHLDTRVFLVQGQHQQDTQIRDRTLAPPIVQSRDLFIQLRQAGYHSTPACGIIASMWIFQSPGEIGSLGNHAYSILRSLDSSRTEPISMACRERLDLSAMV